MSSNEPTPVQASDAELAEHRYREARRQHVDALVLDYQPIILVALDGDQAWEHVFPEGNTGLVIGVGNASWLAARAVAEYIVDAIGRKPWTVLGRMLDADSVHVHGTVAELEQLQAEVEQLRANQPADGYLRGLLRDAVSANDALRTERDNLTANAARLRRLLDDCERRVGEALGYDTTGRYPGLPALLIQVHDEHREVLALRQSEDGALVLAEAQRDALRAEVTRIVEEHGDLEITGGVTRQLRTALDATNEEARP